METIIVTIMTAVISGGITLIGVILSNNKKQAVMEYEIAELTREVREHNNFAKRMPTLEEKVKTIENEIRNLREYHK